MRCPKCSEITSSAENNCSSCGAELFPSRTSYVHKSKCVDIEIDGEDAVKSALKDWTPPEPGSQFDEWDHETASRLTRLLAQGIDFSFLFLFVWGVGSLAETGYEKYSDILIYLMGFWILFNFIILIKDGQTIGKKILKIKIAELYSDTVPSFWRIVFGRGTVHIFNVTSFLGIINLLFIFRKDKRCLHDLIAGTWVVKVTGNSTS